MVCRIVHTAAPVKIGRRKSQRQQGVVICCRMNRTFPQAAFPLPPQQLVSPSFRG